MKTETEIKAKIEDMELRQAVGILRGESTIQLLQYSAIIETLEWILK
jgi:hypothetical protein